MLDNSCAILFVRGERAVKDLKYDILKHPNIRLTEDGGAEPYVHGKVEGDVADIFIEEYREISKKDKDDFAQEETGYEFLSDADILEEIEKEEKENGQKDN